MPNLVQLNEQLKGMPDAYLQQEAQTPSGMVPPVLVLGEMQRRETMRGWAKQAPQSTVLDDVLRRNMPPPGMQPAMLPRQAGPPFPGAAPQVPGLAALARPPVRMQGGGMVPGLSFGYNPYDPMAMVPGAAGGAPILPAGPAPLSYRGVPFPTVPKYVPLEYKLPEYKIEETPFEETLKKARELYPTVDTSPLERRINQMEAQRAKIKTPGWRDVLMQTGLGLMASRAPNVGQALGESGMAALWDYRTRKEAAQNKDAALLDRIAGLEMQQQQEKRAAIEHQIGLAGQLQSWEHGRRVTEMQGRMGREKMAFDIAQANQQGRQQYENNLYNQGVTLAQMQLQGLGPTPEQEAARMREFERQHAITHADAMELARLQRETQIKVAQIGANARHAAGLGVFQKTSETGRNDLTDQLIKEQYEMQVRSGSKDDTDAQRVEKAREYVARNVMNPQFYAGDPRFAVPGFRQAVAAKAQGWTPPNKDFLAGTRQTANKAREASEQAVQPAAVTPTGPGGLTFAPAGAPSFPLTPSAAAPTAATAATSATTALMPSAYVPPPWATTLPPTAFVPPVGPQSWSAGKEIRIYPQQDIIDPVQQWLKRIAPYSI